MAFFRLMAVLALAATATLAQQYNGNYVESDYDYDQAPQQPQRHASPPQRSYSRPPAPSPISRPSSPAAARPTPVPILKQINRHNEDGSYTYGYEGADGSFKIETKLQTGEVMGKYGYVDDLGKVRVVEYGANRYGFQPSGEGITVAPPTLVDETKTNRPGEIPEYDDGQYYDQPAPRAPVSRPRAPAPQPQPRPAPPPRPVARPAPAPTQQYTGYDSYQGEQHYSAPRPAPARIGLSQGPVPPRAQIPGAVPAGPSGGIVYSSQSRPSRPPAPVHHAAPAPPRPQVHQAPVYHAQPVAPPRPAHQARHAGAGILDQLAKDYALPAGGSAALSDISFGYYS